MEQIPSNPNCNNADIEHRTMHNGLMGPTIIGLTAISMAFSPIIMPAFAAKSSVNGQTNSNLNLQFTPSGVDSQIAKLHQERFGNKNAIKTNTLFRFTPAGLDKISNRTLTVAARTNETPKAVNIRNVLTKDVPASGTLAALQTTKYSLKQDKGWKGFELTALPKLPVADNAGRLNRISTPSINYKLKNDKDDKPSRFSTSMKIAKPTDATPSPLGNAAGEDYTLNLGGSFSISKRIDLTAGVRYDRQNDIPLSSIDSREDSEAVYVGTKIRF